MPCESVQLMRVELPKMNRDLRDAAIRAMGTVIQGNGFLYQGSWYYFQDGKLIGRDAAVADVLKRAYSAEVVKYAARRNGWQIKQVGQFQYQVIKS